MTVQRSQLGLMCQGLTRSFDDPAKGIFDIDLNVHCGSVYALLGENGAGKSTLIHVCLGFLAPQSGSVSIAGIDVASDPVSARAHTAYVPEVARLYGHLSGIENMSFFDRLMGRKPNRTKFLDVLTHLRFPLTSVDAALSTYSKGMRQKIVLALGLLKGANVFLLDEPTSGLDPTSAGELARSLRILRDDGRTILFSSHDLGAVEACADIVGVMRHGRLAVQEPMAEFRRRDSGMPRRADFDRFELGNTGPVR